METSIRFVDELLFHFILVGSCARFEIIQFQMIENFLLVDTKRMTEGVIYLELIRVNPGKILCFSPSLWTSSSFLRYQLPQKRSELD